MPGCVSLPPIPTLPSLLPISFTAALALPGLPIFPPPCCNMPPISLPVPQAILTLEQKANAALASAGAEAVVIENAIIAAEAIAVAAIVQVVTPVVDQVLALLAEIPLPCLRDPPPEDEL